MGGEGSGKKKKAVVKKAKEPKVPVVDGKKGKNPQHPQGSSACSLVQGRCTVMMP